MGDELVNPCNRPPVIRRITLNLFAAPEIGTGHAHTKITDYKKREDFLGFPDCILADQTPDKEIHVILDNYSTHKKNDDWLAKYEGRVQFHFTPISATWLKHVEMFLACWRKHSVGRVSKARISCLMRCLRTESQCAR